jgi:hypothetical protein
MKLGTRSSERGTRKGPLLIFSTVLLWVLCTVVTFADESGVQFEHANGLYRAGKYKDAVENYEQIVKNGYESSELYFNIGNAYYKQGNYPRSIIAYERAKRLAPHDEDIAYNLRLANLRIVDKIEPLPMLFIIDWWTKFVNVFTAEGWAMLTMGLLWGMAIVGGVFAVARSFLTRRIAGIVAVLLLSGGAVSLVCEVQRDQIEQNDRMAVVISQSVPVKSAPDPHSTDLFVIHEGLKLEVLDVVGDWKKVRLADGKIGWMEAGGMETI